MFLASFMLKKVAVGLSAIAITSGVAYPHRREDPCLQVLG